MMTPVWPYVGPGVILKILNFLGFPRNFIFCKTGPKVFAYFTGVLSHYWGIIIHQTKPDSSGYQEVKGFWNPSTYSWEKAYFTNVRNFGTHCSLHLLAEYCIVKPGAWSNRNASLVDLGWGVVDTRGCQRKVWEFFIHCMLSTIIADFDWMITFFLPRGVRISFRQDPVMLSDLPRDRIQALSGGKCLSKRAPRPMFSSLRPTNMFAGTADVWDVKEASLSCRVTSFPRSIEFWQPLRSSFTIAVARWGEWQGGRGG